MFVFMSLYVFNLIDENIHLSYTTCFKLCVHYGISDLINKHYLFSKHTPIESILILYLLCYH